MKAIIALVFSLFSSEMFFCQTTTVNWTKIDCDGNTHNIYEELDHGNIIILDFIMLNCTPCVTASYYLETIYNDFKISHPENVKAYTIGYLNNYTCQNMKAWTNTNNFTMTKFIGGETEVAYYGGMGMPTIVVLGGTNHNIFYNKLGFSPNDDLEIRNAINQALNSNSAYIENYTINNNVSDFFPNPSSSKTSFIIRNNLISSVNVEVYNTLGKKMETIISSNKLDKEIQFDINILDLKVGVYFVKIAMEKSSIIKKLIVSK